MTGAARDRKAERHEATRREILDLAWRLAAERGLTGWTLKDVADAVGVRTPSLYVYFASKNAVYDALFAEGYRQLAEGATEIDRTGAPLDLLRRIAHYFVEFLRRRRGALSSCSSCARSRASSHHPVVTRCRRRPGRSRAVLTPPARPRPRTSTSGPRCSPGSPRSRSATTPVTLAASHRRRGRHVRRDPGGEARAPPAVNAAQGRRARVCRTPWTNVTDPSAATCSQGGVSLHGRRRARPPTSPIRMSTAGRPTT